MSPVGLLSFVLLLPAAPPASVPHLRRGDELTYTGTVTEAVDRPTRRFRRAHDLTVRVFVLDRQESWADAAVLTLLRRTADAAVTGAIPVVTGADLGATPPAARLDLIRIYEDGTVHLLAPPGPAPLRLTADTPVRLIPAAPLDSFAPFEFGLFPSRPRRAEDATWTVAATEAGQPAEQWSLAGNELINRIEQCARLEMVQQSTHWEKPRGGETSWQRAETVWVSTQDGTARRVHRTIRQRDGIASTPAVQIEVKYELKDRGRLMGRFYERYRREIETAYTAATELEPLARAAVKLGPDPFKARLARLDTELEETAPGTPYREAVLAVRRRLEAAARGDALLTAPSTPLVRPDRGKEEGKNGRVKGASFPALGEAAPDFRTGSFHLGGVRGRPVLLVFFMPGQPTTDLALAIAGALDQRYGNQLAVVPLVVFADVAQGVKDRDRLKLTVPVFDGASAAEAYAVETFPRFVLIDAAGKTRWTFHGVGAETGYLARDQMDTLAARAAAPAVKSSRPGTVNQLLVPRP